MNALAKHEAQALALRDAVTYDPLTGLFHRRAASSRAKQGDPCGCLNKRGYLEFNALGSLQRAHRLAWLYVYGKWPAGHIDHIDGNRANNAIANLRDVPNRTNSENRRSANKNSTTGLLGTRLHKSSGKYEARIRVAGRLQYLGLHDTPESAHAAYVAAKRQLHEGNTL
jgi:hypothetical protein